MSIYDKINIYVSPETKRTLDQDMHLFEIYKPNGKAFNQNRFLSMLIQGYYDTYVEEKKALFDGIIAALSDSGLSNVGKHETAATILNTVILPDGPRRSGKGACHLSLKPTANTEALIQRILHEGDDYVSQFIRRLLVSYCKKPFSQREQIVFQENYEQLTRACEVQHPIYFNTIWNVDFIHEVVPYSVSVGPEEMFNYLLCQEKNPYTHQYEARAYALRRIRRVNVSDRKDALLPNVRDNLDRMLHCGPQYAINDGEEICVRLTDVGVDNYMRIYFGRPAADRRIDRENSHYFYFTCSKDQVFLYFIRFPAETAEILTPESLRQRMKNHYQCGAAIYTSDNAKAPYD